MAVAGRNGGSPGTWASTVRRWRGTCGWRGRSWQNQPPRRTRLPGPRPLRRQNQPVTRTRSPGPRPAGLAPEGLAGLIAVAAIRSGFTVLYRSIFDVVRDFLHEDAWPGTEKVLNRYLKPDLLVIDDMGMKQLPRRGGEVLFEIIMRRHETRSTMMTSNRPLEDWGKLVGDVPSATAILDRFLHHAEGITITGRSYRLRDRPGQAGEKKNTKDPDAGDCPPAPK